jgi:hypothetical protein
MSRARNLFSRFGTIDEQRFAKPARAIERVNRAGEEIISEGYNQTEDPKSDDGLEGLSEQEDEEDALGIIEKIKGAGASEGHDKTPAYAEHGPDYVKFGALSAQGQPFVATMPYLSTEEGIAWVNNRIKGFSQNPKARESYEEAIRRKGIAAMGEDFISAMKLKGGDMVKMELDMMLSKDSHSGIGNLDMISKKPDVVNITIDRGGEITGLPSGVMTDELGQIFVTQDMAGRL